MMALELRDLEKAAKAQGWIVTRTKKGHPRFIPPDPAKPICTFSGTPGDVRAIWNFLSQLRRSGFIWPWPPRPAVRREGGTS
jgi:hypothetical protein